MNVYATTTILGQPLFSTVSTRILEERNMLKVTKWAFGDLKVKEYNLVQLVWKFEYWPFEKMSLDCLTDISYECDYYKLEKHFMVI